MVAISLTGGVLLGWLIADLATVFLFAHLDRMPLSLLYPFAIAGGAGYLMVRGSPLGPLGTLFGMLAALLPVYIGDGPIGNVDVAYGLVCGIMLGVVAALLAARFLWPRSATQMFTERAASQLDLCRQALASAESGADVAASLREDARLVSDFAKQLSQLGQLRAQAHSELGYEPLDDQRRVHLLALMHELFDASLRAPHFDPGPEETAPVRPDEDATRTSLRAALARQDEAIVFSITAAAEVLRGVGAESGAALSEARALVEAQIDSLRRQSPIARSVSVQEADAFLAYLASRRELATRQLGVEAWLADWREAQATF